ncbi:MAG: DUF1329 domain-containing protein [Deltaproteobacteria bacterium]|nr:DUF1329 domain-containing protein [Deltaproteobacteria bacterium]
MNIRSIAASVRRCTPLVIAGVLLASAALAQDVKGYTRATFDEWVKKYQDAEPAFKAGDIITQKDLDKLRPFIPPGYIEQLDFPEFRAEIGATGDYSQHPDFMQCTEQYQSQVALEPNGALKNYVCGQPFDPAKLKVEEAEASGLKAAWNYNFRWQNYGLAITDVGWIWDRFDGGTHKAPVLTKPPSHLMIVDADIPADTTEHYQGGGTFQRMLQGPYRKTYFSHLAKLREQGAVLPGSGSADFESKEYTGFHDPFDIRGTAFIIYRYNDPLRADDAWAYVPSLRRVRRISVETKSDSLLGTDHTLEDFYSFSGRVLDWNWRFLGWKKIVHVMNSKYLDSHYGGPNGIVPHNDRWELRNYAIVERTPRNPRHPYSAVVMLWDTQTFEPSYSMAWDKKGKLWKFWQWQKKWSEEMTEPTIKEMNVGQRVLTFQSINVLDLQNDRGTHVPCYGRGYPDVKSTAEVEQLYDVSRLEELHR